MRIKTDNLAAHLTNAKQTLAELPDHVDCEPALQTALEELMRSGNDTRIT